MALRNFLIVALVGASLALAPLEGLTESNKAATTKPATTKPATTAPAKPTATTQKAASSSTETASTTNAAHKMYGNMFAVCACGKVFTPDSNTKYIENLGTRYACCSDACHEMGMKDPAASARKANEQSARVMTQISTTTQK